MWDVIDYFASLLATEKKNCSWYSKFEKCGKKLQSLTGEGKTLFKAVVKSQLSILSHLIVCRV